MVAPTEVPLFSRLWHFMDLTIYFFSISFVLEVIQETVTALST